MTYKYFSHNGEILPVEQAVVRLDLVEYAYGFGVYETIRVSKSVAYFLEEHCFRLLQSAKIIDLSHPFSEEFVKKSVLSLLEKNKVETGNIKILLIGGPTSDDASLEIMCLNPLFPDRKLYKTGVHCITYNYEREFPGAKTLNMLPSYLAFRQARLTGAYDALLVNHHGYITEGTRTNFFGLNNQTIISPPADQILPGVTRSKVLEIAEQNGFEIIEQAIKLTEIDKLESVFLTSTSAKILPIRSIGEQHYLEPSRYLKDLMTLFADFQVTYSKYRPSWQ